MKPNKILLIAFKFPPYAGVGGFRWAKMAKYLARSGHVIHVVTVDWKQNGSNTFLEDIQHENIRIHKIPSGYPHNLKYRQFSNYILKKVKLIFFYVLNRFMFYDDEAQHWGKYLIPYCEKMIDKENIPIVIATGHPFQANYWASVLKIRNPTIKLIQDFRDPWVDEPLKSMNTVQKRKITEWQRQAISSSDALVAVTEKLLEQFITNQEVDKAICIPNGYDPETLSNTKSQATLKLSFAHLGNVSNRREIPLIRFLEAVVRNKHKLEPIQITLVGNLSKLITRKFTDLIQENIVKIIPTVSQKQAHEILCQHTYALHFNAEINPEARSTKIYEYGAMRKTTVSINYGSEIKSLIKECDLGYSVNLKTDNIDEFLIKLSTEELSKNFKFKVEAYSYLNLANNYSNLIQSL